MTNSEDRDKVFEMKLEQDKAQALFFRASETVWWLMASLDKYFGSERLGRILNRIKKKNMTATPDEVRDFIHRSTGLRFTVTEESERDKLVKGTPLEDEVN